MNCYLGYPATLGFDENEMELEDVCGHFGWCLVENACVLCFSSIVDDLDENFMLIFLDLNLS